MFKRVMIASLIALALLFIGYQIGYNASDQRAAQILQAQWDGETKRLQYAYEMTDSCASDQCLEAWSELIGDVKVK